MKVRKYEAANMQEALLKIRADLGNDAVILHTKKINKGGPFSFLGIGREIVEVLAASDVDTKDGEKQPNSDDRLQLLQMEIREMKQMFHSVVSHLDKKGADEFSPVLAAFLHRLINSGIEEKLSKKIVRALQTDLPQEEKSDTLSVESALLSRMAQLIGPARPIKLDENQCKIVALAGPTGVGKTTTIAKLAAHFVLSRGAKTALITADTFRIAAIQQLKTYAEIIGAPMEVVFTPREMRSAVNRHIDKDLILMDTAGHSQKNAQQMFSLKDFMDAARPQEIHVVLSATTKTKDLLDVFSRFSVVPISQAIFTKLDETSEYGPILNVISSMGKPLSYVTTGQNVPQDIETVEPKKLARMILGEEVEERSGENGSGR